MRLPSEEELRSMVTPEQVCSWAAMLAAEQRLKVNDSMYIRTHTHNTLYYRMLGMEGNHCLLRKMRKTMGNWMMRYTLS